MPSSNLSTITPIAERSAAAPALWNTRFTQIDNNFTAVGLIYQMNPKAYGATGDGTTDDTTAIQACINAAAGKRVQFTEGTYVAYALNVPANTVVDLGNATIKKRPAIVTDQTVAQFTGNATVFSFAGYAPLFYATGNNVTIRGGTIDGNRANDTLGTSAAWGGSFAIVANRAGILAATSAVPSLRDITIDNVTFVNMVGCAIDLECLGTIRVTNCSDSNASHNFANITSDVTAFTTNGYLEFSGNILTASDRVLAPAGVTNPIVLDRKKTIVFHGNTIDESLAAASGGCKFQDSYSVTITGNAFINSYVKPQSAAAFYGDSFVVSGNTFVTYSPSTHLTGVSMGSHRVKALTIIGNSITNGCLVLERSCDLLTVIGNTIRITADARYTAGGTTVYYAISGGANQNSSLCGTEVVANNAIDLGGLASHCFYQVGNNVGDVELRGNKVAGAERLFSIMTTADTSAARLRLLGNTFTTFRAIGRFNLSGILDLTFKGNVWSKIDTATVTSIDATTSRYLDLTTNAGTYGRISIEGETINARETDWFFAALALNAFTLDTLSICNNVFNVYDSVTTGWSMGQTGGTITTLSVKNNMAVGDLAFAGTHTAELIEGNSFATATRKVTGCTKKQLSPFTGTVGTTVGAAGAASALPATPTGYAEVLIDGVARKIPYYA